MPKSVLPSWVAGLATERQRIAPASTAERVVDVLRERISQGEIAPGSKLSEETLSGVLGVSRNTLREAFRLMSHERLVVHELNRGVFVRTLTPADVADLYRVRRLIECSAVRHASRKALDEGLPGLARAVAAGQAAAEADDWQAVGTADLAFHQNIAFLEGSPRVDALMRALLAELRLVFHVVNSPRQFHEPYLERNEQILQRLAAYELTPAERLLRRYLDDAEAHILANYPG